MGGRINKPEFDQSRFNNVDVGGDYYKQLAEQELIPRIAERNHQVLNVVPEYFKFYQRSYTGRRCSCWLGIETSPSAGCLVCFGTGNTASYQMYGHITEVFDVTAESAAVGVVIDYSQITRPLQFRLVDQVLKGHVDFVLPVRGGLNVCSLATAHAVVPRGTRVRSWVRLFTEGTFVPFSMAAITERLEQAQTTGGLHLRVQLERDSISASSPRLSHLRVRYQTLADDRVRGDIPRAAEANRTSDFGFFEDISDVTLFLDSTLRSITTEDLFRHVQTGRLWKVSGNTPNAPAGILTSWDVQMRRVQGSERYANLP